ncbi:hypothetical protein HHK36_023437 [Tetracentron sinense]|uniref:Uncharacterized protein n=1 Tax=Tetracentron sinense TaxID=13715 RepID=A0A834YQA8_TETSI|nr:hypothetical protein HHK36_023437 [Tetracentron sinense]
MPSGPKRRKAAKKKQEKTPNIDSPTNSQGNDDLKSYNEKESDGGEVSSPTSQAHQHHQLAQEEGEEKRESSSVGSVVTVDHKPMEGSTNGEGEGTQKVEPEEEVLWVVRELKPEDDSEGTQNVEPEEEVLWVVSELKPEENSESQNFSIEHVGSVKESHDVGSPEDSRSLDNSSSDEESGLVDKNPPVMEQGKLEVEVFFNSDMDTAPLADSVVPVVSMSEEATLVVEATPVEIPGASDVIELVSEEKEVKMLPPSDENTGVSPGLLDLTMKENEDKMLPLSDENTGVSSSVMDKLLQQSDAPSVETSNGGEHSKKSEIPESSENQVSASVSLGSTNNATKFLEELLRTV